MQVSWNIKNMHCTLQGNGWCSRNLSKQTKETLTCDNKVTLMPMSKNCRKMLIVLVTGSTEPAWDKSLLHQNILNFEIAKIKVDITRQTEQLGYKLKRNHKITSLNTTLCKDCTIKERNILKQSVLEYIQNINGLVNLKHCEFTDN